MGGTLIDVAGFDDRRMNETRGIKELEKSKQAVVPTDILILAQ